MSLRKVLTKPIVPLFSKLDKLQLNIYNLTQKKWGINLNLDKGKDKLITLSQKKEV